MKKKRSWLGGKSDALPKMYGIVSRFTGDFVFNRR
jgi:hypothetical protein